MVAVKKKVKRIDVFIQESRIEMIRFLRFSEYLILDKSKRFLVSATRGQPY